MKSRFFRFISAFLSIVLVIHMLPLQIFAKEMQEEETTQNTQTANVSIAAREDASAPSLKEAPQLKEDATILMEIVENRTEFSKEYRLSNGLNLAIVYPEAVHYQDAGQWKDIDNTLQATGYGDTASFRTQAGAWRAEFPQQMGTDAQVRVSKDAYVLAFGLAGELRTKGTISMDSSNMTTLEKPNSDGQFLTSQVQLSQGQVHQLDYTKEKQQAAYPEVVRDKIQSRLSYSNVYANTDIVYDINSRQVKESIVINQYDAALQGYLFILDTGTMTPVLNEDNSIDLVASGGEVIMTMPAPFMVDNAGVVNTDVQVMLEPKGNSYILAYQIPTEWLAAENRSWPVVLDPVVKPGTSTGNILDHFVAQYYSVSNSSGALMAGYHKDFGKMRTYIKFSAIPTFTSSDVIVNAKLGLHYLGGSTGSTAIEAHKVTSSWTTGTITWANQPTFNSTIEDYCNVANTSGYYYWDITDIARDWYSYSNTGVMLKGAENSTTDNWKKFYSVDYSKYTPEIWPYLEITYQTVSGLESYWDYTTSSAGRAGTGYVNNFTGSLTWVHDDLGFGGNRMPVSISHIYNISDCNSNEFGLGYGWRTNYNQTVEPADSVNKYIWTDGDGTRHYFIPGNGGWVDQSGLQLTLQVLSSGYKITDKYGNTSTFDSYGRLTKLTDNQRTQSHITITYNSTSKRIAQITDGVGRVYKFTYNSNLLEKIGYHGGNGPSGTEITNVQFDYTPSSNLATITYKDNLTSSFGYSGYHLISATDVTGYKIQYAYFPTGRQQIADVQEVGGDTEGVHLSFNYVQNWVKITKNPDDTTSATHQIKRFNNMGNLISAQDEQGRVQLFQYADTMANQLTMASQAKYPVVNLLDDNSFENGNTWSPEDTPNIYITVVNDHAHTGQNSLMIEYNGNDTAPCAYGEAIVVPANTTCSFSAYVQSYGTPVRLALEIPGAASALSEIYIPEGEFRRLEVSYTNESDSPILLYPQLIMIWGGYACIDSMQVEFSPGAGSFNLLSNGDFRTDSSWSENAIYFLDTETPAPQMDKNAYEITGNIAQPKSVTQTVAISGQAGDAFTLAGWAKADAVPLADGREFGLKLTFNYNQAGTPESHFVSFDPNVSGENWQYAALCAVADRAYHSITVELVYSRQANTAWFDGIQLHQERLGTKYTYYDNGNLKTETDILGSTTTYSYYPNNEVHYIDLPDGTYIENDYTGHLLTQTSKKAPDPEGGSEDWIVYSYGYEYDAYGNQTAQNTIIVLDDGEQYSTRVSTATYLDGNYLESATDEQGNTTEYDYNPNTGVLNALIDPNGAETSYQYDNMFRMTHSSSNINPTTQMHVQYIYGGASANANHKNQLVSIVTPTTTYNFDYNAFGQRASVSVGDTVLATYTYTDVDKNLKTLEYGNGDVVNYTYDKYGRLLQETYTSGDSPVLRTITYQYNANNELTKVTDTHSASTVRYYYNSAGQITGQYTTHGTDSHSFHYLYDDLGRLVTLEENVGAELYATEYEYDEASRVSKVTDKFFAADYTYDDYSRLDRFKVKFHDEDAIAITATIYYDSPSSSTTSGQVASWRWAVPGNASGTYNYNYTYDDNGNIVSETVNGKTTTYEYDSANQLIRENNEAADKTWVWTYDGAGNILSKTEFSYTLDEVSGDPTVIYTYGNDNWGDLLVGYGNTVISYDTDDGHNAIGNPSSVGTWHYTWEYGRQLASMSQGSTTWNFTYDANGMRTQRTNGSVTYTYLYNGSQLTQMTRNNVVMRFSYGTDGRPLVISYNDVPYYYITNLQGDVVAIVNSSGTTVVKYVYDAWGRLISTTGSMASTLGQYNPLRYRGYIYDHETGLYYLQSRYYNPTWGRFINADVYTSTGQGMLGNNMFVYCNNNPTIYRDEEGTSFTLAVALGGAAAGALINLTSYLVGCGISGKDVTGGGIAQALIVGAACGVFGAAAGAAADLYTKALYAGYAAFVAAMSTEINGGNGLIAGGATFLGAFGGALIDTDTLGALADFFANFAVGLFTGAPAEMLSSGLQNIFGNTTTPTTGSVSSNTSAPAPAGRVNAGGGGGNAIVRICYV